MKITPLCSHNDQPITINVGSPKTKEDIERGIEALKRIAEGFEGYSAITVYPDLDKAILRIMKTDYQDSKNRLYKVTDNYNCVTYLHNKHMTPANYSVLVQYFKVLLYRKNYRTMRYKFSKVVPQN